MTIQDAIQFFTNIKGNQFVSLKTNTVAKLRKTGVDGQKNLWGEVRKESHVLVNVGFHYANAVANQCAREGVIQTMEVSPRAWGARIVQGDVFCGQVMQHSTPFVVHNDKIYVEVKVERVLSPARYYVVKNGGNEYIDASEVSRFLPPVSVPEIQANLHKKVILRDYAIDTITELNHISIH